MKMESRSRSPSPNKTSQPIQGHRCSVILTAEQWDAFSQTGELKKQWFGTGHSIPVKDSLEDALGSFFKTVEPGQVMEPCQALLFHIPLATYHDWVHEGVMVRYPHLGGYRIKANINVKKMDPNCSNHPLSLS